MTSTAFNVSLERDRAQWERYARLIESAGQLETVARSSRVPSEDAREMLQEAAELRARARGVSA